MSDLEQQVENFSGEYRHLLEQMQRVVVGLQEPMEVMLVCLLCGGHALLEGVPGVGKTLLVTTLARVLSLRFSRIQFTPDLMPADITGTNIIELGAGQASGTLRFRPGPVFANIVLADEINRATPKTQAALLEAMQERQVTVGDTSRRLENPFMVLATQNPLEMEGTYPLPEAQLDRFMFKIVVPYPRPEELAVIVERTTGEQEPQVDTVAGAADVERWRRLVRRMPLAPPLLEFISRLVTLTNPQHPQAPEPLRRFLRCGASPRAAQALALGSRVRALLAGRYAPSRQDVLALLPLVLRHRLLLNYAGEAEGVAVDDLIDTVARALD